MDIISSCDFPIEMYNTCFSARMSAAGNFLPARRLDLARGSLRNCVLFIIMINLVFHNLLKIILQINITGAIRFINLI